MISCLSRYILSILFLYVPVLVSDEITISVSWQFKEMLHVQLCQFKNLRFQGIGDVSEELMIALLSGNAPGT